MTRSISVFKKRQEINVNCTLFGTLYMLFTEAPTVYLN